MTQGQQERQADRNARHTLDAQYHILIDAQPWTPEQKRAMHDQIDQGDGGARFIMAGKKRRAEGGR